MATTFTTASATVTAGVVTDGVASALTVNSGCACFEAQYCSVVVGTSVNETLVDSGGTNTMLGYVYTPTALSGRALSPASLVWVRCAAIDFAPSLGAQFASSGALPLPPGAMKFVHLPFQMATSLGGSTFTTIQSAKRSGS